ncbi:MAG: hypothetical protein ABI432_05970 [Flavobacteriales bacterium]
MRVVIGMMAALGLLAFPLGLALTVVCILALGYSGGVEIDTDRKKLREYSALFGLRWGAWGPLTKYKHVSVLHVRRSSAVQGRAGGSTSVEEMNYDVCLLDETHRKKLVVTSCDTPADAERKSIDVALTLGFDIVRFAPQQIRERRR